MKGNMTGFYNSKSTKMHDFIENHYDAAELQSWSIATLNKDHSEEFEIILYNNYSFTILDFRYAVIVLNDRSSGVFL